MKRSILFAAVALFMLPGLARSAAITGVVIQSCKLGNHGIWVAEIRNASDKNVVFVSMSPTKNSRSGSYYSANDQFTPPISDRLDEIGLHRGEMGGGPTFPPNTPKEVTLSDASECATAVVDVVVYADDTAEVTNEDAFRDYLKPTEEEVLTLKKENEILAQFAASPNRIADTVAELLRVASELPDPQMRSDENAHVNPNNLMSVVRELKQGRINRQTGMNEKVDPETIIKENTEQIEIESKHLHIKRI